VTYICSEHSIASLVGKLYGPRDRRSEKAPGSGGGRWTARLSSPSALFRSRSGECDNGDADDVGVQLREKVVALLE
jgi:hypothetical protein